MVGTGLATDSCTSTIVAGSPAACPRGIVAMVKMGRSWCELAHVGVQDAANLLDTAQKYLRTNQPQEPRQGMQHRAALQLLVLDAACKVTMWTRLNVDTRSMKPTSAQKMD
jgi:hypothetical protein